MLGGVATMYWYGGGGGVVVVGGARRSKLWRRFVWLVERADRQGRKPRWGRMRMIMMMMWKNT